MIWYPIEQVVDLATQMVKDYIAFCREPDIRGLNGEEELQGNNYLEIAKRNNITAKEVEERTINLANARYEELPSYWQGQSIKSARAVINTIPLFANRDLKIRPIRNPEEGILRVRMIHYEGDKEKLREYAKIFYYAKRFSIKEDLWPIGRLHSGNFDTLKEHEIVHIEKQLLTFSFWLDEVERR